jgi:glycosyltransferase involved in cell wall biosynthesis
LIRRVAVVVPAANEERRIAQCLSAIAAARQHLLRIRADITVQTTVVLDDCQDGTGAIAATFGEVRSITTAAGSVGAARRAGTSAALGAAGSPGELWLANTDADSQVPLDWLTTMVAAADLGVHLVLGTALPGPDLDPEARAAWLSRHDLRAGHSHVHGANFGIRGDIYLGLGGWQPLVTGEDADLAERAARTGRLQISRTAAIPVITSVRRGGRAPRGFSSYLRDLDTTRDPDTTEVIR